ncbi:hypothetical protein [Leptospira kirschneri]|uniref:hypothetical protein n=1 Tax=Leptospira kirschneri TaxID=29507 RepID=UPI00142F3092|nr:hypothetical protein [Leptospira kirschneri]
MSNEIEAITIVFKDKTVVILEIASIQIINPDTMSQIQDVIKKAGVVAENSV